MTGKAQELLNAFIDKTGEVANQIRTQNPELFPTDTKQFQENVEKRIRTVADSTEELRKKLAAEGAVVSEKLENVLKTIVESTVSTANTVRSQVENAITPKKQ